MLKENGCPNPVMAVFSHIVLSALKKLMYPRQVSEAEFVSKQITNISRQSADAENMRDSAPASAGRNERKSLKMEMFLYSVYDLKAEYYMAPAMLRSDAEAIRMFDDMCGDESHPVGKHPADYVLYRLGAYDQYDGKILPELKELRYGK